MRYSEQREDWYLVLTQAREGCSDALGRLLEPYREWLLGVADRGFARDLKAKEGASDLVQQTYTEAVRAFAGFRGSSPEELRKWLEAILGYRLIDYVRRYRTGAKRQIAREVSLATDLSGVLRPDQFVARDRTPRSEAVRLEESLRLEQALSRLDPRDAQILRWRNHDHLTFPEIGRRLDVSADVARKSWVRALGRLRGMLGSIEPYGRNGGLEKSSPHTSEE